MNIERVNNILRTWRHGNNASQIVVMLVPQRYVPAYRGAWQCRLIRREDLNPLPTFNPENMPVNATFETLTFYYRQSNDTEWIECEGVTVWERWR